MSAHPSLSQHTELRQSLRVNPRLYQAMDLLALPLTDLQQRLTDELSENPFLEMLDDGTDDDPGAEGEDETPTPSDEDGEETEASDEREQGDALDWDELIRDGTFDGEPEGASDTREQLESVVHVAETLAEHLDAQLGLVSLAPRCRALVEEIVGGIDDDGYLTADLTEIVGRLSTGMPPGGAYTLAEAEDALRVVQRCTPTGVGARSLAECLLLQLAERGQAESVAARVLRLAFEDLAAHRWGAVAKRAGVSTDAVGAALKDISSLDPKPGRSIGVGAAATVVPDVVVERADDGYRISLNDVHLPRLRISPSYQRIVRDTSQFSPESRAYVVQRLNAAAWMVQAIEQRRQTILRVMTHVVEHQRAFLAQGVQALRPLTLREVADAVGVHESTVSRVTHDKYVQTPRGVIPMRYFFSSGLATDDGPDMSARGIRDRIQRLVHQENRQAPLTDQELVQALRRDGIQIARRTVAKYREQLHILPARLRCGAPGTVDATL